MAERRGTASSSMAPTAADPLSAATLAENDPPDTGAFTDFGMETTLPSAGLDAGRLEAAIDRAKRRAAELAAGPQPGGRIGPYIIEHSIGMGGGGAVYKARHTVDGRAVAVKVLSRSLADMPGMVERFVREADTARKARHPNIVEIFDLGESGGELYYAMEYMQGRNLQEILQKQGRLSVSEIRTVLDPVLAAVQAAHEVGVVHRDLKASNIMVCDGDGASTVKLLDFGIAKLMSPEAQAQGLTTPGQTLGTAQYMAPEQIRGQAVDARTDVYALGALIFQLATGEMPFNQGARTMILASHLLHPPPRPSDLVPSAAPLDAIVLRCMEKKPEDRFATAALLREHLAAIDASDELAGGGAPEIAVQLEIHIPDTAIEEADDDVCSILDLVEVALSDLGLSVESTTSSSLCAVRVLDSEADLSSEQAAIEAQLVELRHALEQRASAHPGVRVQLLSSRR